MQARRGRPACAPAGRRGRDSFVFDIGGWDR
jgi:hypothetical protein